MENIIKSSIKGWGLIWDNFVYSVNPMKRHIDKFIFCGMDKETAERFIEVVFSICDKRGVSANPPCETLLQIYLMGNLRETEVKMLMSQTFPVFSVLILATGLGKTGIWQMIDRGEISAEFLFGYILVYEEQVIKILR